VPTTLSESPETVATPWLSLDQLTLLSAVFSGFQTKSFSISAFALISPLAKV